MREKIAKILRWQASELITKNKPKIIVVTGSIGKSSTTKAIYTVLSESFKVRSTLKNYNTNLGVPCSIFGCEIPENIKNPFAWALIIAKNQIKLYTKADFEILVLELGTDSPGDIKSFSWLQADVAVVTAISEEHMEYFKTIDAVAREELSVAEFSDKVLINLEMVDSKFFKYTNNDNIFNYSRNDISNIGLKPKDLQVIASHSIDAVSAALAVAKLYGVDKEKMIAGAKAFQSLPGRMQSFRGVNKSTIIDDTYNSSPEAVIAALNYVYSTEHKQKIVLLGNMNELGCVSEQAHSRIGKYCDPKKLDLVVTLGEDANHYTADAAKQNGCNVAQAMSPYEAADIIKNQLKEEAVVLCKGSQNGVFAEEAVKLLLENPLDDSKLVRQSKFWIDKKKKSFGGSR